MNQETKQLLLSLLKDVSDETILVKYMEQNGEWNCKRIKEDLENEGEISKDFFNNLFRCARDILIHKAKRNEQKSL